MHGADAFGFHNPVVHELSLAGWLISTCHRHEESWAEPETRGHILRCCGEVVGRVGELADLLCDRDPEVADEVRRLATLLAHRGQQLEGSGD
ncbi:hypothetical protein [Saccharopolyspora rosea]|uniref:hypothetical protein n=1 Tax=Saccharopolyspora rosea TaxID=524884 RepID=UPI0021DA44CA|nr:hypothetical protein [Saccharopolyspora rosea]